jgi:hypothetical protein
MVTGSSGALKSGKKTVCRFAYSEKIGWVNSNLDCMISERTQRNKARVRNKLESSKYALLHIVRAKSALNV